MPPNASLQKLMEKAIRLSQTNETWEFSTFLARGWITPRREAAYRPYLSMTVSSSGKLILSEFQKQPPSPETDTELLLRAMKRPALGAGRARRPQIVCLDNENHVSALTPILAELNIRCQHRVSLPLLNKSRQFIETGLRKGGEAFPGLLTIPGVTPPMVEHLYQLAADYHRASPWAWLTDLNPLVISYPPQAKPRYGFVMGSAGASFGLAVYDTVEDVQLVFRREISNRELVKLSSWIMLLFESPISMSFDDLDAITQYGWPVVNEKAYPLLGRTIPANGLNLPNKADLFWMEGALSGILNYLPRYQTQGRISDSKGLIVPVTTINGAAQLRLQMPRLEDLLRGGNS
ncbi:conserved hypothetical protein [Gammaproteobacteria bacterium]